MARKCPYCGAELLEGKQFCIQCGRIIHALKVEQNTRNDTNNEVESDTGPIPHEHHNNISLDNKESTSATEYRESTGNTYEPGHAPQKTLSDEADADTNKMEVLDAEIIATPSTSNTDLKRIERSRKVVASVSSTDVIDGSTCSECQGTGRVYRAVKCDECDGTGECQACYNLLGSCSVCKGTKVCPECHGTGTCTSCGGTGSCSVCEGSGTCYYCDGSGCEYCSFTGVCQTCNGSGQCPECKGLGLCEYCNGNGMCPTCHGTGSCVVCGGSGKCTKCGGTGIIGYTEEICTNCGGLGIIYGDDGHG